MSISSILSSGLQGLQSGINRTAIPGGRIAAGSDDLARDMVAMRQGEIDVKAAANVIKTGDQILGTLLDIRG